MSNKETSAHLCGSSPLHEKSNNREQGIIGSVVREWLSEWRIMKFCSMVYRFFLRCWLDRSSSKTWTLHDPSLRACGHHQLALPFQWCTDQEDGVAASNGQHNTGAPLAPWTPTCPRPAIHFQQKKYPSMSIPYRLHVDVLISSW